MTTREHGLATLEYLAIAGVGAVVAGTVLTATSGASESIQARVMCAIGTESECAPPRALPTASPTPGPTATPSPTTPASSPSTSPATPTPAPRNPACEPGRPNDAASGWPMGSVKYENSYKKTKGPTNTKVATEFKVAAPKTLEIGPKRIDSSGGELQDVSVEVGYQPTAEEKVGLPKDIQLKLKEFVGNRTKYTVTVPSSKANPAALATPPNVLDPTGMQPGEGVTLTNESYAGGELQASYKLLIGKDKYERGQYDQVAVRMMPDGKVRVLVGPGHVIKESMSLGVGAEKLNAGLGSSRNLKDYELRVADFDVSTQEGLEAYYRMLWGGQVPSAGTPGVSSAGLMRGLSTEQKAELYARVGDAEFKHLLSSSDSSVNTTTYLDGTEEQVVTSRSNGVTRMTTFVKKPGGEYERQDISYRFENVDKTVVSNYNQTVGGKDGPDREVAQNQNMVVSYTPDEMKKLKRQALLILAEQISVMDRDLMEREFQGKKPTPEQLQAYIDTLDDRERENLAGLASGNLANAHPGNMAVARNDWEMMSWYIAPIQSNGSTAVSAITSFALDAWLSEKGTGNRDLPAPGPGHVTCRAAG